MTDSNNFNKFSIKAIDDSVVSVNLFPLALISIFWNNPA